MPVDIQKLFAVLQRMCDAKGMTVTIKESMKGGFVAGAGAFAGGLLGGPVGIFLGGSMGSAVGAYMASGKCVPVSTVIMDMSERDKQLLYVECQAIVADLDWTDVALVTQLIMADALLTERLMHQLADYLHQQFKLSIDKVD